MVFSEPNSLIRRFADRSVRDRGLLGPQRVPIRQRTATPLRLKHRIERLRIEQSSSSCNRGVLSAMPWQACPIPSQAIAPDGSIMTTTRVQGATSDIRESTRRTCKNFESWRPWGARRREHVLKTDWFSAIFHSSKESARLQTFPDDYVLHGAWTEAMRQLGNAVPVLSARPSRTGLDSD